MRVNPSAQLHAILAYFAITALANDFIEFEIAIFDVEDPAEAVQVSLVDLYRGAVQDASLQTFCEQHSLDLRPCADLLNAVDRGRAQPHADPFRLAVMIEKPIIPTRLPIDSLSMDQMLGMHLLLYVMHGREVLDDHGYFVFPPEVKRVVIDVGAHHCEQTASRLAREPDLGLIAVEPNIDAWRKWPLQSERRLIGLPFAVGLTEGLSALYVPPYDHAASLFSPNPGEFGAGAAVPPVAVQVVRLQRVLDSVPAGLDIVHLKTDCQGMDADVLESGGDSLRRVALISSEVIFSPSSSYAIHSAQSPFPRMLAWMKAMGFAYTSCFPSLDILNPPALVSQVDAQFLNLALAPKQWISELLGVGQPWAWDPVAMERHWDPSVPFQRLHEPNDTEVWVTGYGDD